SGPNPPSRPGRQHGRARIQVGMTPKRPRRLVSVLAVGFVAAFLFVFVRELTLSPIGFDEESFIWCGWSALKGLSPYKDFFDFMPPLLFLTEAAALGTLGLENGRFRYFISALALGSLLALLGTLLRRGVDAFLATLAICLIGLLYFTRRFHDSG